MDRARTLLVPRERGRETRVALVPTVVPTLLEAGWDVVVEPGAGDAAGFPDQAYVVHGARIAEGRGLDADLVAGVRVGAASEEPLALEHRLRPGTTVIGIADASSDPVMLRAIGNRSRTSA